MTMLSCSTRESGGKTYKAYVRERKKADGEYQQAALNGQTTAQVTQTR